MKQSYETKASKGRLLLARLTDYFSFFLAGGAVSLFLPWFLETYDYLIFAFLIPYLYLPLEAVLLSRFGTTLGKALFGIKAFNEKGKKLSFKQALKQACCFCRKPGNLRQSTLSWHQKLSSTLFLLGCIFLSFFGNTLTQWGMGLRPGLSQEGWIEYTHDEAGFKVHFPRNPEEEVKQLEVPGSDNVFDYQELTAHQDKKVYYSVTYMELPRKWKLAGSNTLLKGTLGLIVHYSPETTLLSKELITHQSHRALNFHMKQGEEEVKGRLILVGTTLYKLTVVYPPELASELEESLFLDSFDLSR